MTMGLLFATGDEDSLIDAYAPQTDAQPAVITHMDTPGRNLQHLTEPSRSGLPDPAIGGQGGSGRRLGWSIGVFSRRQRFRNFDGAMANMPAVTANPVQGVVGTQNNHGGQLWAGVKNQLADYQATQSVSAATYVGNVGLKASSPNPSAVTE